MFLLRIVYWISFIFVIGFAFGYENSVLNPGPVESVVDSVLLASLFAVIGGLALARNIQKHGWNRYEISTIFTSLVVGIGSQCFP